MHHHLYRRSPQLFPYPFHRRQTVQTSLSNRSRNLRNKKIPEILPGTTQVTVKKLTCLKTSWLLLSRDTSVSASNTYCSPIETQKRPALETVAVYNLPVQISSTAPFRTNRSDMICLSTRSKKRQCY
mmetsp:Transcript_32397/g.63318  ORF Transcript_32397/g.63318 Transcript_32397/m.63318 type:complete len:127 (-) Transcript_32397:190-570(-)